MKFEEWEPAYKAVLADFGFDRSADERARDVLAGMAGPFDHSRFDGIEGTTVAIAGAGPSLAGDLDLAADADYVLAASSAADVLRDADVPVDCMVTDLDKNPGTARALTREGVPVVVHAHGDNVTLLREHVPSLAAEHVLATTQAEPSRPVENFGGFTDGDRAAFLADHFGADGLVFPGWDFDDPAVSEEKRRKLQWAARLLRWLEIRRAERFGALDGRREGIEPPW